MICPICKQEGKKSMVMKGSNMSTLAGYMTYYDENGIRHHHDENTVTQHYYCTEGHKFYTTKQGTPCPSYPENCDFDGGEERLIIEENPLSDTE